MAHSSWRNCLFRWLSISALVPIYALAAQVLPARANDELLGDDAAGGADTFHLVQQEVQPPPEAPARQPVSRTSRSMSARSTYVRLARAPNMFGDQFSTTGQLALTLQSPDPSGVVTSDFPLAGGRLQKIGENNKPIPMDRVYFIYNHFHNALTSTQGIPPATVTTDQDVNRYTVGCEATFLDGLWSVDLRMPFTDSFEFNNGLVSFDSGEVGNAIVFLKRLLYTDDLLALAGGVGFGLPTGSDLHGDVAGQFVIVQNEALHLVPYVGFLAVPDDLWFIQGFAGIDLAANGNEVLAGNPAVSVGRYTEQNLVQLDLSAGRWLYDNPDALYLTRAAAVVELHYTTTIQDTDNIQFISTSIGVPALGGVLTNIDNRTDVLNLTGGVQIQIGELSNLRVGGVAPLRMGSDRQFDTEVQVSFNRYF